MKASFLIILFFSSLFSFAQDNSVLQEIEKLREQNKANRQRIEVLLSELKDQKIPNEKDFKIDVDKQLDNTLDFSLKLLDNLPDLEKVFSKIQNNPKTKKVENKLLKMMNTFKEKFEREIEKIPNKSK